MVWATTCKQIADTENTAKRMNLLSAIISANQRTVANNAEQMRIHATKMGTLGRREMK